MPPLDDKLTTLGCKRFGFRQLPDLHPDGLLPGAARRARRGRRGPAGDRREPLLGAQAPAPDPVMRRAVSKVANFAVDLPDAAVAIQISGTFGSRQEEAQRLGRIIRPKKHHNIASFYSVISKETVEQDFARNRQLFLIEQGYEYEILEG